jgi:hypothetical protein
MASDIAIRIRPEGVVLDSGRDAANRATLE